MAKKDTKKTPTTAKPSSTVTRISAKDEKPKTTKAKTTTAKVSKPAKSNTTEKTANEKKHTRLGGYFRGAWSELKQVRWPDRLTTWKMTGTLILFCLFFVVLILLVDLAFQYLFNRMIG